LNATDQSPIEMDPVEPALEQPFRPAGGLGQLVQSPLSAKSLNLIPGVASEPSIAASSKTNGATGLLKHLTELQLQNNNLLKLQTLILEQSHWEALSRIENRLIEWADTNMQDYDPSDQHTQHASSPKCASPSKPSRLRRTRSGNMWPRCLALSLAKLFHPQQLRLSNSNGGPPTICAWSADPEFRNPEGPGHPEATFETLKIIREEMDHCTGISAFCPDVAKEFSDPENMFLWSLAVNTFVELIERGEYTNISLGLHNESTCCKYLANDVGALFQYLCIELSLTSFQSWTFSLDHHPEATRLAEKWARQVTQVNKLQKNRGAFIYHKTELRHLESIFKACCSEDDSMSHILSDDGMSIDSLQKQQPASPPRASSKPVFTNKKPKRCKVTKYYWCSAAVDDLIIMLDDLGYKKNAPKNTVTRLQNTKPKIGLPIDFYDQDWLANLPPYEVTALKIISELAVPISTMVLQVS
ncbi:hypothetical protein PSTT_13527, partial [Puccinia striiformis]